MNKEIYTHLITYSQVIMWTRVTIVLRLFACYLHSSLSSQNKSSFLEETMRTDMLTSISDLVMNVQRDQVKISMILIQFLLRLMMHLIKCLQLLLSTISNKKYQLAMEELVQQSKILKALNLFQGLLILNQEEITQKINRRLLIFFGVILMRLRKKMALPTTSIETHKNKIIL